MFACNLFTLYKFKPDLSEYSFNQLQTFLYDSYPQILGALVITGFLPSLPERIHIQNLFREFAQRRANIPDLARNYYKNIKRNGLDISNADIETIVQHYSKDVVQTSDFKFREQAPEKLWAYTCYLYYKIRELSSIANRPYSKNISKKELAFANFKKNFDQGDQKSLAFSLLSGLTCSITACCIDKKPALWKLMRTVLYSASFSLLCFILYFAFSLIAIVIGSSSIDVSTILSFQFWDSNLFILLLAGLLGLIVGFVNYFTSAYSKKIEQTVGIVNLNISHYLVPLIENRDRELSLFEARRLIESQKMKFPRALIKFFTDQQIFDDEGNISEKGFIKLKRLAFAS